MGGKCLYILLAQGQFQFILLLAGIISLWGCSSNLSESQVSEVEAVVSQYCSEVNERWHPDVDEDDFIARLESNYLASKGLERDTALKSPKLHPNPKTWTPVLFDLKIEPDTSTPIIRKGEGILAGIQLSLSDPRIADSDFTTTYLLRLSPDPPYEIQKEIINLDSLLLAKERRYQAWLGTHSLFLPGNSLNPNLVKRLIQNIEHQDLHTLFLSQSGGKSIAFVSDSAMKCDFYAQAGIELNGKMGLADSSGKLFVPVQYDFIHPYGTLLAGHAEVVQKGKLGLINTRGEFILPVEFDFLLPTGIPDTPLVVNQGKRTGVMLANHSLDWEAPIPDWISHLAENLGKTHNVEALSYSGNRWHLLSETSFQTTETYISPPFSYVKLGFCEKILPVTKDRSWRKMIPLHSAEVHVKSEESNQKTGLIARLENWFFAGRFQLRENRFVAHRISRDLSVREHKILGSGHFYGEQNRHYPEQSFREIGKDTFEIRYDEIPSPDYRYQLKPQTKYLVFNPNGQVRELRSHLTYPFTEFAKMDSSYLKVHFLQTQAIGRPIPIDFRQYPNADPRQFFWVRNHYTIAEIRQMIRDLKGLSNRTSTQQHNLAFLTEYEKGMQGLEDSLVNWQLEFFYQPGDDY